MRRCPRLRDRGGECPWPAGGSLDSFVGREYLKAAPRTRFDFSGRETTVRSAVLPVEKIPEDSKIVEGSPPAPMGMPAGGGGAAEDTAIEEDEATTEETAGGSGIDAEKTAIDSGTEEDSVPRGDSRLRPAPTGIRPGGGEAAPAAGDSIAVPAGIGEGRIRVDSGRTREGKGRV